MARKPRKEGARSKKRGKSKKGASGRRSAPKRLQKRLRKSAAKVAKVAKSNRRASSPATLERQLNEAQAHQAATAEILKIIAGSPDDVKPVFEAIVVACARLFRCDRTFIQRCDGANFEAVAAADLNGLRKVLDLPFRPIDPDGHFPSRAAVSQQTLHLPDWTAIELPQHEREMRRKVGINSALYLPVVREGQCIGVLGLVSKRTNNFSRDDIALAESFRDQALIAIENARLFNETKEALAQQTASAEVLKVIASSPGDLAPMFDVMLESAMRLCEASHCHVWRFDGQLLHAVAVRGDPWFAEWLQKNSPVAPIPGSAAGRIADGEDIVHVADRRDEEAYSIDLVFRDLVDVSGVRTSASVALRRDETLLGMITVYRQELRPFADKQIALLQNFAAQAVIAMENARLFNETKEALARQTATADVLKVIASSPSDLQPVFDAIAERSKALIGGHSTIVVRYVDGMIELVAFTPVGPEADAALRAAFPRPISSVAHFERIVRGEIVETVDTQAESEPERSRALARARDYRSRLMIPLRGDGGVIGTISTTRKEPGAFADKDKELLQTFADQAVIAIQNAELFEAVQARTRDLQESLQQQTATADVLKVISRSAFDLDTVMDTLTRSARRLCGADGGALFLRDGDMLACRGVEAVRPQDEEFMKTNPVPLDHESHMGGAVLTGTIVNIGDIESNLKLRRFQQTAGFKAFLAVPLMREGQGVGVLTLVRFQVGEFTPRQVELVQTFADQAVIAIENVRLFDEVQARTRDLEESLQQQTATADVLKVISRSAFDLQTVLDTLVESAYRLCGASLGLLYLRGNADFECKAIAGVGIEAASQLFKGRPIRAGRGTAAERVILTGEVHAVTDFFADPDFDPVVRERIRTDSSGSDISQLRSTLAVPMTRENEVVGVLVIASTQTGPFPQRQIELLQTFADQAVIAIENLRLFNETREALARQTATADVLKVIASSPSNLQPVFDAIAARSKELVAGHSTTVFRFAGDMVELVGATSVGAEADAVLRATFPMPVSRMRNIEIVLRGEISEIGDVLADTQPDDSSKEVARARGWRSRLVVPLKGDNAVIGFISITRKETGTFADKDKELVRTFADQAVIAIQNVELFEQVQARTRDLQESLQQQTATAEILSSISGSMNDTKPVFDAIVRSLLRLFDTRFAVVQTINDGIVEMPAADGEPGFERLTERYPRPLSDDTVGGIAMLEKRTVQFHPVLGNPAAPSRTQEFARDFGFDSVLFNPMLSGDKVVGAIGVARHEAIPFDDKQIALIASFANQAVIAIENTRLLRELRERTDALTRSLDDLRAAQDRLVQTEKLASLGQLTAGIAHEIKNPLNFVNNFSALSVELTDELNDVLGKAELTEKIQKEVGELTQLLKSNLEKVVQHGKRADSIVKNMLLHSREGSGEQRAADINSLVEESLNLAYHGARAEKSGFNITLQREFDAGAGSAELFPQEMTRALLNLISNGFYAASKRKAENGEAAFEPTLLATTKDLGHSVEIRIRDNGTGIPPEVKEKMFNPFFTTKPAGEGTGLGLSMTHDIIVKQHGGTIDVACEPGNFTEFIVVLPRANGSQARNRGQA